MDFGKVPEQELNSVDFSLPPEPPANKAVLEKGKLRNQNPSVYIGCAKWGRKEWIGKIYPKGTKDAQFLEEYVKHYNAIELNATHYKIYSSADIAKWAAKAKGLDFKFCPKIPQSISHYSSFKNADGLTTSFLEGIFAFKENLGPIFLQVSESYSPARRDSLFQYLLSLPKDLQVFVEVRHPDWFANRKVNEELVQILQSLNIGLVLTDAAGKRDCVHMQITVPKTFIRYVGNSLHPTDFTRIDAWIQRLKYWLGNGLQELYFFMHMHNEALSPDLTVYLVDKLNAACNLQIKKPQFIQPGLF